MPMSRGRIHRRGAHAQRKTTRKNGVSFLPNFTRGYPGLLCRQLSGVTDPVYLSDVSRIAEVVSPLPSLHSRSKFAPLGTQSGSTPAISKVFPRGVLHLWKAPSWEPSLSKSVPFKPGSLPSNPGGFRHAWSGVTHHGGSRRPCDSVSIVSGRGGPVWLLGCQTELSNRWAKRPRMAG